MLIVAVLAAPDLGEAARGDAGLVEGSKALIAAVEFPFFVALEAMVVIEFVLIGSSVL